MINYKNKLMKLTQYVLIFVTYMISSSVVYGQMLSVNPDGTLKGQAIHYTKNYVYFKCEGVVSEQLIDIGYTWLTNYSSELGVDKPQNKDCVISQGLPGSLFAGQVSVDYYISTANSICFYSNYCTDSRSMSFKFKDGELYFNFMITNLAKGITEQMCVASNGNIMNKKGCALLK